MSNCAVDKYIRISIHALREESDIVRHFDNAEQVQFLSTLSVRRATQRGESRGGEAGNFYPRSP